MSERTYCVYKHTNIVNGKSYIGITGKNPQRRWNNGNGYKTNQHFWNAIQKYGWDGFDHEILLFGLSQQEALDKEVEYISMFSTMEPDGYNQTEGGEGCSGWKMTDEQRAKISEANKGRKRSAEICDFLRMRQTGKKHTPETIEKMRRSAAGRKHTEETIQKLREIKKKQGIPHGAVVAAAEKHKRPVAQYDFDGNEVRVWSSAMDAERECGFEHSSIARCARGKIKYHKGFVWKYI